MGGRALDPGASASDVAARVASGFFCPRAAMASSAAALTSSEEAGGVGAAEAMRTAVAVASAAAGVALQASAVPAAADAADGRPAVTFADDGEEEEADGEGGEGKSSSSVKRMRRGATTRRWTPEEEARLRLVASEVLPAMRGGSACWVEIARRMGGDRSEEALHQHWQIMEGRRRGKAVGKEAAVTGLSLPQLPRVPSGGALPLLTPLAAATVTAAKVMAADSELIMGAGAAETQLDMGAGLVIEDLD